MSLFGSHIQDPSPTRVQFWEGSGLWLTLAAKGLDISSLDRARMLVESELSGRLGVFDVEVRDQHGFLSRFRVVRS